MRRVLILIMALAVVTASTPAMAESEMRQSPLLMRRAGPSCQPGHLQGDPGAGYNYQRGPCAGVDASDGPGRGEVPDAARRRRRF